MDVNARQLAAIALCSLFLIMHKPGAAQQTQQAPASGGPTIQVKVNVLVVPVIVRDAKGHAVGNLKKEDFTVLDQGKPRAISALSIQKGASLTGDATAAAPGPAGSTSVTPGGAAAPAAPQPTAAANRFIVFLFDDRHLSATDLLSVKKAATELLDEPLADTDRAVVLSFLGVNSGMTHDHAALQAAIMKLKAQQVYQHDEHQCPDVDYHSADQIINKHSAVEFGVALEKTASCMRMVDPPPGLYEQLVKTAGNQSLLDGDQDARATFGYVRDVVHTMSKLPGQRTLILVSPGFLSISDEAMNLESQLFDFAASSKVTISALDARGLSTGVIDESMPVTLDIKGEVARSHLESMRESENVMAELADGTGGTFFHNNNDLEGGLRSLAAGPEYLYLLELSLQDVKPNGTYHSLKVEVDQSGLKLRARRGYFAPLPPNSKQQNFSQEMNVLGKALWSRCRRSSSFHRPLPSRRLPQLKLRRATRQPLRIRKHLHRLLPMRRLILISR
jgi:VWFA-related protein